MCPRMTNFPSGLRPQKQPGNVPQRYKLKGHARASLFERHRKRPSWVGGLWVKHAGRQDVRALRVQSATSCVAQEVEDLVQLWVLKRDCKNVGAPHPDHGLAPRYGFLVVPLYVCVCMYVCVCVVALKHFHNSWSMPSVAIHKKRCVCSIPRHFSREAAIPNADS